MKFKNRAISETITAEWVDNLMNTNDRDEIEGTLVSAMSWFERNHPAVGEVRRQEKWEGHPGFELRAIPKSSADREVVARGLKGVFHRVEQGEFDE